MRDFQFHVLVIQLKQQPPVMYFDAIIHRFANARMPLPNSSLLHDILQGPACCHGPAESLGEPLPRPSILEGVFSLNVHAASA